MPTQIQNRVGAVRRSRGIAAADLAAHAGVSRQTIYAIEAGAYVPNTEVTLKLARALEVAVEELFSLDAGAEVPPQPIAAEILGPAGASFKGQAVRVCRVGDRTIGVPVQTAPYYLPEADGLIAKLGGKAQLAVCAREEAERGAHVLLAGCDPAIGLVSRMVEKAAGVEIIPAAASSRLALTWLVEGKVHIAGSHLEDPETGEFNLPFLRREFPNEDFAVVTFARWEEGFVTAPGNPKRILEASHLARRGVRFINREPGSGSRALLEMLLAEAGVDASKVTGFRHVAHGHLAAAYAVHLGEADCCLATHSAARGFGLDFVPLRSERYDFIMRRDTLALPAVQTLLDVMQRASLRRKLEHLAGYDTAQTGSVLS